MELVESTRAFIKKTLAVAMEARRSGDIEVSAHLFERAISHICFMKNEAEKRIVLLSDTVETVKAQLSREEMRRCWVSFETTVKQLTPMLEELQKEVQEYDLLKEEVAALRDMPSRG